MTAHTVNTSWREARAAAALELATALEHTLDHVQDVDEALDDTSDTVGRVELDPLVQTGRAYAAMLRSRISELRGTAT